MALKDLAPPVRPKATLVYSPHPLLVDAGRVVQQTVTVRGEKLGGYLRRHGIDTDKPLVVTVDGKPVARDEWELLDPEPGQLVAARGAVAGGDGGGSQVVAMVAMIALAVFAPYLAGAAYGMMTSGTALTMAQASVWAANSVIGMVMTGAVTMAGSMLINKLMPAPKMDLGKGLGAPQASANYSITGGQNRARPFEPLALVLGTHRVFFDLAGRPYSTYQGEDQYLYQVFCVGLVGPHGTLDVSDLRIGTTLLSTYEGVTTETSIGTMPAMMPANVDTIAGASITAADPQTVRTTSPNTTKIELDFTAMAYRARSDGDIEGALLDWTIEYCAAGTGAWQTLEYVSTYGNGQKPIRLSRSYSVASGTYDVRVTGHTLSTSSKFIRSLTWDAVKCYQPDDGYYEGQQFLAVKIKATGQLNGVIDRLNGIVRMPTAPGVYSSNPADLFKLFAIGHKGADGRPLWGGQLSSGAIDTAGLDAWKTWCTAKGLTFNAVLDSQRSVWDVLQSITRCGRGSPTWAPGKLGVVWDADNQPVVANFGMSNIKRGSFEVAYQSEAPVEEVVLTYVNAADDYAADTVRALAPGVTSPTKSATIELWGCDNQAMAVKECHLALAENLYRTRLVSWETDMEGLVVTRGDVVSLSHDLTQWGKSGRLVAGTTTEITLDQAIPLESTGTWIGITAPDGTQYTCRVAYQAGEHSEITLLDPLPIAPDTDSPVDWRYTADYVATPGKLVKIVSLVPSGMESVKISAVDEYDEYYAAENGTYTPPTKRQWLSNQPQIRALGVSEEIVKSGGSHSTKLIISWTEAGNVASRLVRYSLDGGPLEIAGYANGSRFELIVPDVGTVMIVVTLYDGAGQTSSGAQASVTHILKGLAYAPFDLASFSAVGGLFQVRLSWVFQGDINDAKYVEVWGGNTNNRANATLLTVQAVPANGWLHTGLQTGQTWFYWARVIDHKNRPSDFLPLSATAGTSATTSSDPSDLLDALTGSITEDALYIDLASRIDQIDAPTTGALAQISAVQAQVNSLQAEIADISGTEAYDPLVTYQAEDLATYDGGLYRAIQTTTGNAPTNTTYWTKIGDYASLGEAVSGLSVAVDDLETRVTATEGGLSSEVTARSTLATQIRGSYTGTDVAALTSGLIYSERQARSTADASEVTARQALATKMTGAADPSSITLATLSAGLLYDERQARSTADATEVTARQALSAKMTGFSDPSGKVLADLTSGLIFEEKTARVTAVSAVASDVSTLSTTVDGHTASIQTNATSIDGIEAKYTVKIDNNGYVSGYGLISTANNGTPTSAFTILADKFQVVTPGKTPKVPFVVGTVNGASAVGIDGTLVVDGSIVAQKIDTRGLTIKDASGNVILSSGVPLDWVNVGGANRPADGATKNAIYVQDSLPASPGTGDLWQNNLAETPSLDLRFDLGEIDSRITFTRNSVATYFGPDGLLKTAAANEPRIDFDPVTKTRKGLLIEEARTNLLLNSSSLGTQSITTTAAARTLSFYGTGTITLSGAHAATVVGLGAFPTRTTYTYTPTAGTLTLSVSGTVQFANDELGAFATSYIPTTTAAVTRAADVATISGADFSQLFNASEGTFGISYSRLASVTSNFSGGYPRALAVHDGTLNNGLEVIGSAGPSISTGEVARIAVGGAFTQLVAGALVSGTGKVQVAFAYKASDAGAALNGAPVVTASAATPVGLSQLELGRSSVSGASRYINGHIRRLTYYPKRLTNSQLPALTVGVAPRSTAKWGGSSWVVISDIDSAMGSARVAANLAAEAQTDATTANALLADIASDSKLTPVEKQQTKVEWDGIVAEKAGIDAQADSFGITTEKAAYGSAYSALSTYISPLLSSLTTTSDIVGATFRSNFSTLYAARQSLLNKISDEAGKRATWGSSISGKPSDDALLNARLVARPNLVRGLKSWTMGGANWVHVESPLTEDRTTLVIPSGSNGVASSSPTMALGSGQFTVSFRAWSSVAGRVLNVDLFPDTLPQSSATLTTAATDYSFTWSSSHADMASCALRFFADAQSGQIEIGNIKIETGPERSVWVPHTLDTVGVNNRLTASNASTYIANGAFQQAQIGDAAIGTAQIQVAAVDTLLLAGNAVTVPIATSTAAVSRSASTNNYTTDVNLGSITTNSDGRGTVTLFLAPSNGAMTATSTVFGVGGDLSSNTHIFQLLRNGTVVHEFIDDEQTNSNSSRLVYWTMVHDAPGPGVACSYTLRVTTVSYPFSENHSHAVSALSILILETRR